MRFAVMQVSREVLRDALALPTSSRILEVRQQTLVEGGAIQIVIEDEALPEVREGCWPQTVYPTFVIETVETRPKFKDWGR